MARLQCQPRLRGTAAGLFCRPAAAGLAGMGSGPAKPARAARHTRRTAAARLAQAPGGQCHRPADPGHPGRQRVPARQPARPAAAVDRWRYRCLVAGHAWQPSPGCQRADPCTDAVAVDPRAAAPRPCGYRHRHDRRAVLRFDAAHRAAGRSRHFLAIAPGRCAGRDRRRHRPAQPRPAPATPALQLGDRGRTGAGRPCTG